MTEPCSKCGEEPRVSGQRWGKKCRAAYMRVLRLRQRNELKELRRIAANVPRSTFENTFSTPPQIA